MPDNNINQVRAPTNSECHSKPLRQAPTRTKPNPPTRRGTSTTNRKAKISRSESERLKMMRKSENPILRKFQNGFDKRK